MSQSLSAGYDGHNLLVIAGTPRSGTTWVQRLLAAHPRIRTGQESNLFSQHIGPQLTAWKESGDPKYRGGMGLACYFSEEEFHSILRSYLLQLLEPMVGNLAPGEMFLEKTPSNALYLQEIFALLPRVRVIHVLRDARDVVSSLTAGDAWLSSWAPASAKEAARTWVRCVTAVREAAPSIPAKQFYEIKYVDLSSSPVEELRKLADFLELDWDLAGIQQAIELNRADKARKTGGTPIPLHGDVAKRSGPVVVEPQGFIRRAEPGGWKTDLSPIQKFWVWRIAHRTMAENGYHWSKGAEFAYAPVSSLLDAARWSVNKCLNGGAKR